MPPRADGLTTYDYNSINASAYTLFDVFGNAGPFQGMMEETLGLSGKRNM